MSERPAASGRARRWITAVSTAGSLGFLAMIAVRSAAHGLSAPAADAATGWWLALATAAVGAAYLTSAAAWMLSSPRPLPYWRTLGVGLAASAANRVVPAGLAGTGLLLRFFNRCGLTAAESAATVAVNKITGGLATLALVAAATGSVRLPALPTAMFLPAAAVAGAVLVAVAVVAHRSPRARGLLRRGRGVLADAAVALRGLLREPHRAAGLLVVSAGWTVAQTVALQAVLDAFGRSQPFGTVLLVVISGMIAGSAVPTPNGLGATDAVLVAGLDATGTAGRILSVVVVYRLMTFWLPVLPGLLAARSLRARSAL